MDALAPERALLLDALGLETGASAALLSREPLGDGSVAGFRLDGANGDLTYFVDTSGRPVAQETGMISGTPDEPDVRIWLHPADPHLPAFAPVAFAHAADALLERLGIRATGAPSVVAYRPGRRAVISVATDAGTTWLKVVPPTRVAAIVEAQRRLAAVGIPVPELLGWSETGLLVSASAHGIPVADAAWTPSQLVDTVDELRASLAGAEFDRPARTALHRRLDWYAERLQAVLPPDEGARVEAVAVRCRETSEDASVVAIHGDLHFGQLFLDEDGRISGVIDVDTAGIGAASDDAAAFVAHAVSSALLTPEPEDARVRDLACIGLTRWRDKDGSGVLGRTATLLLGQALGAVELGHRERGLRLLAAAEAVSQGDVEGLARA